MLSGTLIWDEEKDSRGPSTWLRRKATSIVPRVHEEKKRRITEHGNVAEKQLRIDKSAEKLESRVTEQFTLDLSF